MAILSGMALHLHVSKLLSIQGSFYIWPLVFAVGVMTYGGSIEFSEDSSVKSAAKQTYYSEKYALIYADSIKAVFRTEDGVSLATVGSTLSSAGTVVSIEKRNGHWTVSTSKKLTFVLN